MEIFKNKVILVTGHTGFKGAWLALWLKLLGAHVVGYSLDPPSDPNLFTLVNLQQQISHYHGDICDYNHLRRVFQEVQPDFVFHLAAQSLVLPSYEDPRDTFHTNVQGTVNVLEAIKNLPSVEGAVVVTSDKCYRNQGWTWGYRENDPLGGNDPYSCSKAMAELAVESYRNSFLFRPGAPAVATARSGNVIGGGDFADFRIIPDIVRSIEEGSSVQLRNPESVRPWLFVLEPLHGYLKLAEQLLKEGADFAEAWNFGPREECGVTVRKIAEKGIACLGKGKIEIEEQIVRPKEMPLLRLNWEKAAQKLFWKPKYGWERAVEETMSWYKAYLNHENLYDLCVAQIENYQNQSTTVKTSNEI